MRRFIVWLGAVAAASCVEGEGDWDEGSDEWSSSSDIEIDHLSLDLDVYDAVISGCLEVSLTAPFGSDMSVSYRFGLPAGAVIHHAEARLAAADRWEPAETLGRREGQAVYDDFVDPQPDDDPLLLQQIGPSSYRARLYPVGREQPAAFRACYVQAIDPGADSHALSVLAPDSFDPTVRDASMLDVTVRLHQDGRIAEGWSSRLGAGRLGGSEATFHAEHFPSTEPLALLIRGDLPPSPLVALAYRSTTTGIDDHLIVQWLPDLSEYETAAARPRNVVFVIDTSGSMAGRKMSEARLTLAAALQALGPEDRFGLVEFDSDVTTFRQTMSGTREVPAALDWVDGLIADGSTALADGLRRAVQIGAADSGLADVLVLTDGMPTEGPSSVDGILERVRSVAPVGRPPRIFSVGIGRDLVQSLLADLADETGGEATFALEDSEIRPQVLAMFERVRRGGVTDVEIEVSGGGIEGAAVLAWPRVFAGTPLVAAARGAALDGPVTVRLRGTLDGDPIELVAETTPRTGDTDELLAVPPLAAAAWAEDLNRAIDAGGETDTQVDEAVRLAKTYGILGRYSSMLALETEELYELYGIDRIEREGAGIALETVESSEVEESRIGGEGVVDTGDWDASGESSEAGCACRLAPNRDGDRSGLVAIAFVLMVVVRRRRR